MKLPNTKAQKRILDSVRTIVGTTGRGATLQEIADKSKKSISTVCVHVKRMHEMGLLERRTKGIFPVAPGADRYREGWNGATQWIKTEILKTAEIFQVHPLLRAEIEHIFESAKEGVQ